jgi:hypothetical protein
MPASQVTEMLAAALGPMAGGGVELVPDKVKEGSYPTIPTPSPRPLSLISTLVQPPAFTDRVTRGLR